MRAAFRVPGFRTLFAGTTTSMFGDSVMLLVFSMWVKELTGSNGLAGLTFFFMVVPAIFAPLLGGPIDRVRRKPMLVWANLGSAAMLLPLFLVRDAGDYWIIWIVAFFYGVSFIVVPAALNGLLKELMPEDQLVDANASMQTVKEAFRLFGPIIGAGLFALTDGWGVVVVDLVSFLVAAFFISRVVVDEAVPEHDDLQLKESLLVGVRHLVGEAVLKHIVVSFAVMLIVLGFSEASVYAITDAFDLPVEAVSIGVSVQGVGAILGGVMVSRVVRRWGEVRTIVLGLAVMGASIVLVAAAPSIWVVLAAAAPFGWTLPIIFVAYTTLLQRRTPQRIMGRVSTAMEVLLGTPQAISLAVGAALVSVIGWREIWAVMAVGVLAGAGYLAFHMNRLSALAPPPTAEETDLPEPVDPVEPVVGPVLTPPLTPEASLPAD